MNLFVYEDPKKFRQMIQQLMEINLNSNAAILNEKIPEKSFYTTSRAVTAQSSRKFRVTVMPRKQNFESPHIGRENINNNQIKKSELGGKTLLEKSILANYKQEIQLNKLTLGFLNYEKIKDFYEKSPENDDKEEETLSQSQRLKERKQTELNLMEYIQPGHKRTGISLKPANNESSSKRQKSDNKFGKIGEFELNKKQKSETNFIKKKNIRQM